MLPMNLAEKFVITKTVDYYWFFFFPCLFPIFLLARFAITISNNMQDK